MREADKPDYIRVVDRSFDAPGQKTTAAWILLLWPTTRNFSEIGRRSGWSKSQVRNVYDEYFLPADSHEEMLESTKDRGFFWEFFGGLETAQTHRETASNYEVEEYKHGYRDGYRDGHADATSAK